MKEKKKRFERSYEEIVATLPKRWKPAKTLEEAKERASVHVKNFNSRSDDLNAIWNLFKAAPEIFLFDDFVNRIRSQYKSSHTYMFNHANTQLDNLEFTLEKIQGVARTLYADLLQQEASPSNDENKNEKEEEPAKKPAKATKKILSGAIKKLLADDKTDIREFMRGCDEEKSKIILDYLKSKGVSTLGEYLALRSDLKKNNALHMFISNHNLGDVLTSVTENIVDWATKGQEANASEVTAKGVAPEEPKKAPVEDDAVQDAAIQATPAETAEQKIEVSDEDFFEYLKTLPASHFVKGSKEMERIGERYREYLDNQTRPFVDECFSEEDLKNFIDEEDKKYRPIVDAKREQYERELKRDAVAAYTRKLIDDSVKYHHDPRMFDHQPKHEGHKHFPDNGREL